MQLLNKIKSQSKVLAAALAATVSGCTTVAPHGEVNTRADSTDQRSDGTKFMDGFVEAAAGPLLRANGRLSNDPKESASSYAGAEIADNLFYKSTQLEAARENRHNFYTGGKVINHQNCSLESLPWRRGLHTVGDIQDLNNNGKLEAHEVKNLKNNFTRGEPMYLFLLTNKQVEQNIKYELLNNEGDSTEIREVSARVSTNNRLWSQISKFDTATLTNGNYRIRLYLDGVLVDDRSFDIK